MNSSNESMLTYLFTNTHTEVTDVVPVARRSKDRLVRCERQNVTTIHVIISYAGERGAW